MNFKPFLFSNKKNAKKLVDQTVPKKLFGFIVHGLYFLSDNIFSFECI